LYVVENGRHWPIWYTELTFTERTRERRRRLLEGHRPQLVFLFGQILDFVVQLLRHARSSPVIQTDAGLHHTRWIVTSRRDLARNILSVRISGRRGFMQRIETSPRCFLDAGFELS